MEADRFQTLLSVLDYSLPPLLFQSVSSSFLSLIFALPSSASFPVEADLTRIPEIQCVFAFTPKVTNYDHCTLLIRVDLSPLPGFMVTSAVLSVLPGY